MSYHKDMFKQFELVESEEEFIKKVTNMQGSSMGYGEVHSTLSIFYLAKQIEKSGKSSDKQAEVTTRLTWAIVVFTAMQGISAIIAIFNNR